MMHPWKSYQRRALSGLTVAVIAVTLALVGVTVAFAPEKGEPPSLSSYDVVKVELLTDDGLKAIPRVDGFGAPSIQVGDDIPLVFARCNVSPDQESYDAIADAWWVGPDGERYPQAAQSTPVEIGPGCIKLRVSLEMPNAVAVAAVGPFDGDVAGSSEWIIEGQVDPVEGDSAAAIWNTETFLIVAPDTPRFPADNTPGTTEPLGS